MCCLRVRGRSRGEPDMLNNLENLKAFYDGSEYRVSITWWDIRD